jgi:hypothetical protein
LLEETVRVAQDTEKQLAVVVVQALLVETVAMDFQVPLLVLEAMDCLQKLQEMQ